MSDFTSATSAGLPGPEWLRAVRSTAFEALADLSVPSSSEEVWRYGRIDELDLDRFHPALGEDPVGDDLPPAVGDLIEAIGPRAALVLTWNGRVVRVEVDDRLAAQGAHVSGADTWSTGIDLGAVAAPVDLFGRLNLAFGVDPVLIDIPSGAVVEGPIVVVHWVTADEGAVFPRVVVRAGENSQAVVSEHFVSADVQALVAPVTELDVAPAANLRYLAVQSLATSTWQIAHQVSRVGRDASLHSTSVALGGDYARVRTDSHLVGQGSTSKLNAVYFGAGSQVHDFRTLQAHDAPKSTSDLLFKGAVGDAARSVYSGMIRVTKGAAGTNAFQTNRNLVLSDGAHADSVPNLEIEENDVRCSHASAVGPIDEEQRYYLESRGVPTEVADRLIVLGFLDEIIASLPVPGLHKVLRAEVARKLDSLEPKVN